VGATGWLFAVMYGVFVKSICSKLCTQPHMRKGDKIFERLCDKVSIGIAISELYCTQLKKISGSLGSV
jgi:hypothetical protein